MSATLGARPQRMPQASATEDTSRCALASLAWRYLKRGALEADPDARDHAFSRLCYMGPL